MRVKRNTQTTQTTLDGYWQAFMAMKKVEGKSNSTLENYFIAFERYKKSNGFGDHTEMPDACQRSTVYKFMIDLQNEGKPASTVNHYIKQIRVFLYFLMREGVLDKYEITCMREQEPLPKTYSDEDIQALLRKPKNPNNFVEVRTWVMINLACACGARVGSIVSLKIESIDFDSMTVSFPHTKNKRYLRVPLTSSCGVVLRQYIKEWRFMEPPTSWLFPSVSNGALTVNGARKALEDYCAARGVERSAWHSLRHTFATHYLTNGGRPYDLKEILGHDNFSSTQRYIRMTSDDLKPGIEQFSLLDEANAKITTGGHSKRVQRNKG